jgi:fluoride exporter
MMLLWVMVAGGLGSGLRYLVGLWAASAFGTAFPAGTLMVNLAGSFLLGLVAPFALSGALSVEARTVIGAGFLGGFTTYSSFNQETIVLFTGGAVGAAALNVAVTVIGCLAAGSIGLFAARALQP